MFRGLSSHHGTGTHIAAISTSTLKRAASEELDKPREELSNAKESRMQEDDPKETRKRARRSRGHQL